MLKKYFSFNTDEKITSLKTTNTHTHPYTHTHTYTVGTTQAGECQ